MRVLDIARTPKGNIVLITEVSEQPYDDNPPTAAVTFIGPGGDEEKTAWYDEKELKVIDSLPMVLARMGTAGGGSSFRIPHDYFYNPNPVTPDEDEFE